MLSFSTEFPVKRVSTRDFIQAIRLWIAGSPHTRLTAAQLESIPEDGRWKVENGPVYLEGLMVKDEAGEIAAFRYVATDDKITWITEAVYSQTDEDDWVAVRTDRISDVSQVSLPVAKKPLIVRTLISKLGGGLDDELHVSDSAYYLREFDARMAIRLLNADADNHLPIVYVSCPFAGQYTIDPDPLARVLGGLAHVVVEPSRSFSRGIQKEVGSRNVYGGRVGVYWSDGSVTRYYFSEKTPKEIDIRFSIVADVRTAHLNRRPLDRCTWSRAEARFARQAIEVLKNSGSGDIDEYVAAFDSELGAKEVELSEANEEVWRLRGQLRTFELKHQDSKFDWPTGDEQELKPHEFNEIIRDALSRAADNEQAASRRQHVLQAVADAIPESDYLKNAREALKLALKNYSSMDGNTRKALIELGFDISDDGKHYKLIYMQDDRYTFSLPKSGSDWRGGQNAVSDIGKRVF